MKGFPGLPLYNLLEASVRLMDDEHYTGARILCANDEKIDAGRVDIVAACSANKEGNAL
jgi:hypothetical protein